MFRFASVVSHETRVLSTSRQTTLQQGALAFPVYQQNKQSGNYALDTALGIGTVPAASHMAWEIHPGLHSRLHLRPTLGVRDFWRPVSSSLPTAGN